MPRRRPKHLKKPWSVDVYLSSPPIGATPRTFIVYDSCPCSACKSVMIFPWLIPTPVFYWPFTKAAQRSRYTGLQRSNKKADTAWFQRRMRLCLPSGTKTEGFNKPSNPWDVLKNGSPARHLSRAGCDLIPHAEGRNLNKGPTHVEYTTALHGTRRGDPSTHCHNRCLNIARKLYGSRTPGIAARVKNPRTGYLSLSGLNYSQKMVYLGQHRCLVQVHHSPATPRRSRPRCLFPRHIARLHVAIVRNDAAAAAAAVATATAGRAGGSSCIVSREAAPPRRLLR